MKLTKDNITLQTIKTESDYQNIHHWLSEKSILKYFGGKDKSWTIEEIKKEFKANEIEAPLMIFFEDTPIGFIDIYKFSVNQLERHGLKKKETEIYGIDIVIGLSKNQNKGIGTRAIKLALKYIFEELKAKKVVLDTYTWHKQAINCYKKCGFKITRTLKNHETYEGKIIDNTFMEITKKNYKT